MTRWPVLAIEWCECSHEDAHLTPSFNHGPWKPCGWQYEFNDLLNHYKRINWEVRCIHSKLYQVKGHSLSSFTVYYFRFIVDKNFLSRTLRTMGVNQHQKLGKRVEVKTPEGWRFCGYAESFKRLCDQLQHQGFRVVHGVDQISVEFSGWSESFRVGGEHLSGTELDTHKSGVEQIKNKIQKLLSYTKGETNARMP